MQVNQFHSYNTGTLPEGCKMCVKGEKLVIFITGLCPRKCYFCPVSDDKFGSDNIYANERKIETDQDLIDEAIAMNAKGAGITGGDPLMKLDRTVHYIKILKEQFGKEFHIHLYTSLNLIADANLKSLHQAGLNEIRFHFDFDSNLFWPNLQKALKYKWHIGVELPLVPNKETEIKQIIDLIHDKVKFLNLNELEIADNEMSKLSAMGFKTKDQYSYAIENSLQTGLNLIEYAKKNNYNFPIHLCTAKLKDATQLTNRIKREAEGVKKKFDIVDKEGLLTRGALYLPQLCPSVGYRDKIKTHNWDDLIKKLADLIPKIKKKFKLTEEDIFLDTKKPRILISKKLAKRKNNYFTNLGLKVAIVTEYPTDDQLEIEVDFL
jgi:uncharacterized protein